jgi:hypothetical protein
MSIHLRHKTENKLEHILLELLVSEETNVEEAEQRLAQYLATLDDHKKRICQLRAALIDLGYEIKKSK